MVLRLGSESAPPIGCLIASGEIFAYARSRVARLPPKTTLRQLVDAAGSIADAQDLVDCEISFGRVAKGCWKIEHSTLPFCEGRCLAPRIEGALGLDLSGARLVIDDIAPDGDAMRRAWEISACAGSAPFDRWFAADDRA